MPNAINYKQKYQELKMKFMESVDAAFRLGFEQGAVQAQQDQMMQQQQAQQDQQNAMNGAAPGEGQGSIGSPAGAEQQANPNGGDVSVMDPSQNPAGTELDQHIAKLESMLGKTETTPEEMKKAIEDIKSFQVSFAAAQESARKSKKQAAYMANEMNKSQMAIPAIAKALHKPAFKIGVQASHNMNANAKAAVGMQEKIVSDIMKSWADEENKASKDIKQIISVEGLFKKE